MTTPAFIIVGRVRKAHGIRGEVVVEHQRTERRVPAGRPASDQEPVTVGRTLLYPQDGDVAGAVATAASLLHHTASARPASTRAAEVSE